MRVGWRVVAYCVGEPIGRVLEHQIGHRENQKVIYISYILFALAPFDSKLSNWRFQIQALIADSRLPRTAELPGLQC